MMDDNPKPKGALLLLFIIPPVMAICMAAVGWYEWSVTKGETFYPTDALYKSVKTVLMEDGYDAVGLNGNLWLEGARWAGFVAQFSAIFGVLIVLFNEARIRLIGRLSSKHVLILGDSAFADHLSEVATYRRVHLRGRLDTIFKKGPLIRLPFTGANASGLQVGNAGQATQIVIAQNDDSAAIDMAMAAQETYKRAQVNIRVHDYWLAQRLHQIPGAEHLRAFSEPGMAASEIVRRHPPYLSGADYGHTQIHALLIGDHDWCEALLSEIILSACTLRFGKSRFSIVCQAARAFHDRLIRRYPEIEQSADFFLFDLGNYAYSEVDELGLLEHNASYPLTMIYCVAPKNYDSRSAAQALILQAKSEGKSIPPVFVHVDADEGMNRQRPGSLLPLSQLSDANNDGTVLQKEMSRLMVPFGTPKDIAIACDFGAPIIDAVERQYHEAYLKFSQPDGEAAKPWQDLSEQYRISNRRAVAHIYAKLFEVGFDLRPWMALNDIWSELPRLKKGELLFRNEEERLKLAELEHDRWIADRRLSGWRYGDMRNNTKKTHPEIKAFKALTPEVQSYDLKLIEFLATALKSRRKGGLSRTV